MRYATGDGNLVQCEGGSRKAAEWKWMDVSEKMPEA